MVSATSQYVPTERKINIRASTPVYNSVRRTRTESMMLVPCRARFSCRFHCARRPPFARFDALLQHCVVRCRSHRRAALLSPAEHVSSAAPRVDQRLGRVLIDLVPESVDVHFGGIGERIESLIPNMFINFLASHDAAGVESQVILPHI